MVEHQERTTEEVMRDKYARVAAKPELGHAVEPAPAFAEPAFTEI